MTALWSNFQRFSGSTPRIAAPETQAQMESLEGEVDQLNQLLKCREEEINARDRSLVEEKKLTEKYKKEAQEANTRYVQVVVNMTEDLEFRDNLEVELSACRAHVSTLSMQLSVSDAAKKKAEFEEVVVAEKLKFEELSESRYKRLRRKYNHYKNKSKCIPWQLSFLPKLRDFSWGQGFIWGFESYRTLEMNPEIYTFDRATVSPYWLGYQRRLLTRPRN
jgi:hypothetical protein